MNAGESGIQLTITSNTNLTGATVNLYLQDPTLNGTNVPVTVGTTTYIDPVTSVSYAAGYWVYRVVQVTDFPINGKWTVQLIAVMPDTTIRKANIIPLQIGTVLH
jgi:hypothetical protein